MKRETRDINVVERTNTEKFSKIDNKVIRFDMKVSSLS